jgi:hypothetical protein
MATNLSAAQAADMIYRSMLTGVPTAEFDRAGGYGAVYAAAQAGGFDLRAPPTQKIVELGPQIAAQGYGNMSYAPGSTVNDSNLRAAGYSNYYEQAADTTAMNSRAYQNLQKQLADMQSQYDRLVAQQSRPNTGGTVGGGGLVDDGSTLNPGQTTPGGSNLGNTGKVYGPDGKEYSSAAAALAAGVTNFTFAPPQLGPGLIAGADTLNSQFLQPAANTGNANPGANIANQNLQLFQMGAPKVALPGQIRNPFA